MIYKTDKSAFSLTELLIVMLIFAFLFAAMAPIVTKRRIAQGDWTGESVWNYVTADTNRDSYYNPAVDEWASIAFIGVAQPYSLSDADKKKGGKLTLRANPGSSSKKRQRQIQFRYGDDKGLSAGSLLTDDSNMILGSGYTEPGSRVTAIGHNIAGAVKSGNTLSDSTLIGAHTLMHPSMMLSTDTGSDPTNDENTSKTTAVGANAAIDLASKNEAKIWNVFVGANSGRSENEPTDSVGVGYNSLNSRNLVGWRNTAVGAYTGMALTNGEENVFAGTQFAGTGGVDDETWGRYGSYNTIVGYNTYNNKNPQMRNMTAIGEKACDSITTAIGSKTCIGYQSGYAQNGSPNYYNDDGGERIFLGGVPHGGFTGRGVLEVHNINSSKSSSVVLNSNLVLRGDLYTMDSMNTNNWTDSNIAYYGRHSISKGAWERYCGEDSCRRGGGVVGKKKYRSWPWECALHRNPISDNYLERNSFTGFSYSMSVSDFPNLSDIRLKENITDNNDGLEKILSIKPFNYTFKNDKNKTPEVGVIAQDLIKIFPNSVTKAKDGFYRIRWDEMFFALINSIKTLNQKVEKIASDISTLASDVNTLNKDNKIIKKRISELNARAAKLEKR